ncbi:MAG TPA: hypothetical protein EYM37_06150 [Methylophaga aminisulfidivorans]|uniref:hypothetical protein n=1 Tax=Methylophaga TaxID=40222 RepID=UPI001752A3BF|nr:MULTISPECIES: hypothetical protein [Methylophaga]HIC46786.1 hypothetical protein [Methylophaga sp.]HIM39507.1 hypothetical protein [Methylophaga aminisulfidivorans]
MDNLIAIINGFLGSLLVVLFLYRLKPKIEISPYIAKNSKSEYEFKIRNKTPYSVLDVKIELYLITPTNTPNGLANSLHKFSSAEVPELDSYKAKEELFGKEFFFCYPGTLETHWNDDNQHLMLVVTSRHSLSQFSKVSKQKFYRKGSTIKAGKFESGENLEVIENA